MSKRNLVAETTEKIAGTYAVERLYKAILENQKLSNNGSVYLLNTSKHKSGKKKGQYKYIKFIGLTIWKTEDKCKKINQT